MRRVPEAFDLRGGAGVDADSRVLGHGLCNGGVETPVQRMKFFDGDGRTLLQGQFCNRLTNVGVVVNHLRHTESVLQQFSAVTDGGASDVVLWKWRGRRFETQRFR